MCFIAFLIFFTAISIYFPIKQEFFATQVLPETKATFVDLNQFSKRVKKRELPKLISTLLHDKNRIKSSGFIYIYIKDGDYQIYKVGRTGSLVGVDKRLKQWNRKCKKKLKLVMKFFVENNHELCESMIHLELKSKGVWCGYLTCDICSGSHKEFFKSDIDTIIETCNFWVDYFNDIEKNKYQLM